MLKGERAEWYLAPGGHRRQVCDLCAVRAQHHGWIREAMAENLPAPKAAPIAAPRAKANKANNARVQLSMLSGPAPFFLVTCF